MVFFNKGKETFADSRPSGGREREGFELQDDQNNKISSLSEVKRFDPRTERLADAVSKVNEGYHYMTDRVTESNDYPTPPNGGWGLHHFGNNCPSAMYSFELRRRGYDVEAGLTGPATDTTIGQMFNMTREELDEERAKNNIPPKTMDELLKSISEMGPGARGMWLMESPFGGHVASFEVDENGNAILIDPQNGMMSNGDSHYGDDDVASYVELFNSMGVVRLDDKEVNTTMASQWTRKDDGTLPPGAESLSYIDPSSTSNGIGPVENKNTQVMSIDKEIFKKDTKKETKKETKKDNIITKTSNIVSKTITSMKETISKGTDYVKKKTTNIPIVDIAETVLGAGESFVSKIFKKKK